jgi:hypothetical protein
MAAPKRPGPHSWGADRELIQLAKIMGLEAIAKETRAETRANTEEGQAAGGFPEVSRSAKGEAAMINESHVNCSVSAFLSRYFQSAGRLVPCRRTPDGYPLA